MVRIEDALGTNLTATYDGKRLYGMQFRAGDPPGRCHFPWGRCGVFNGDGKRNGEVYLSCVQGVAGMLAEPMRWKVKDSLITEVDGGGEVGEECKTFVQRGSGVESFDRNHVRLSPESFGAARHRRSDALGIHQQDAVGGPGNPRKHPNFRHMDGSVFNARLYIDDRLVVDTHGMLDRALLHHPEVLEVAANSAILTKCSRRFRTKPTAQARHGRFPSRPIALFDVRAVG